MQKFNSRSQMDAPRLDLALSRGAESGTGSRLHQLARSCAGLRAAMRIDGWYLKARNQHLTIIPVGLIIVVGFFLISVIFSGLVFGVSALHAGICKLVGSRFTPKGHRLFGSYKDTKAAQELRSQGYGITPDWRSDAVRHIPKS